MRKVFQILDNIAWFMLEMLVSFFIVGDGMAIGTNLHELITKVEHVYESGFSMQELYYGGAVAFFLMFLRLSLFGSLKDCYLNTHWRLPGVNKKQVNNE